MTFFLLYLSLCSLSARNDQDVYLRMVAETVIGDDDESVDGFDRTSVLGNGEYPELLAVINSAAVEKTSYGPAKSKVRPC